MDCEERQPCLPGLKEDLGAGSPQLRTPLGRALASGWFVVVGVGAWLTVNGLFQELPYLVNVMPEGWALASRLTLVTQLANVGPIAVLMIREHRRRKQSEEQGYDLVVGATFCTFACNAAAMLALGVGLWKVTVSIGGDDTSLGLLGGAFVAALADCTSSVTFGAFASRFHRVYLALLLAGEGLSALITSLMAFVQDPSADNPRYSAGVFFLVLGFLTVCSCLSFACLVYTRIAQTERIVEASPVSCNRDITTSLVDHTPCILHAVGTPATGEIPRLHSHIATATVTSAHEGQYSVLGLQVYLAIVNFFQNGVLTSLQPYAAEPYGGQTYHAAVMAGTVCQPIGALVGGFASDSRLVLCITAIAWLVPSLYAVVLAFLSPSVPLQYCVSGQIMVVAAAGLAGFAQNCAKSTTLRIIMTSDGESAMVDAGAWSQGGAFVGAAVTFCMINFGSVFDAGSSGSGSSNETHVC